MECYHKLKQLILLSSGAQCYYYVAEKVCECYGHIVTSIMIITVLSTRVLTGHMRVLLFDYRLT